MESTEHERHVSVFGPPKKQKEAPSGPRVLQRSGSVPFIRDPSIEEPLHGKSFPLSYLSDMGVRGRARGRRPILPQRGRPTLVDVTDSLIQSILEFLSCNRSLYVQHFHGIEA